VSTQRGLQSVQKDLRGKGNVIGIECWQRGCHGFGGGRKVDGHYDHVLWTMRTPLLIMVLRWNEGVLDVAMILGLASLSKRCKLCR
jgi:hypothetical protein